MCMRKKISLLLPLLLLLSACGGAGNTQEQQQPTEEIPPEPYTLTIASSGDDEEMIACHLFENLMRWADDGTGFAVLAPGQAESYTVECDYAGFATYTFTLREGIQWSDGKPVTAQHFVDAWQRLADPANHPQSSLLSVVSGYDQVQETGDASLLAVSAPDERTFVVTLGGACAYFLEELCAGTETVPIRKDLLKNGEMTGAVTNGAFIRSADDPSLLLRSETYYDASAVAPERLHFVPSQEAAADYEKLLAGELDMVMELPASFLAEYAAGGLWLPEPVTTSYAVMLNTQFPPFDNPEIRQAFCLAVDETAVAAALNDPAIRYATGFVPYGVDDHSTQRPVIEDSGEEEPVLPEANATPEPEPPSVYWDFRVHSQELVTQTTESDYAADCLRAQAILAQAGYANGGGFPVVEYLYVSSQVNRTIARALQGMWQEQLGVTVMLRGVSQEEYDAILFPSPEEADDTGSGETPAEPVAEFNMAAQSFTTPVSDAAFFLQRWHSTSAENAIGYRSDAFDILIDSALAAVSPDSRDARDAYLHDAEAILLSDNTVIPLFYEGGSFSLREGLTGLYRRPDGMYFLFSVEQADTIPDA